MQLADAGIGHVDDEEESGEVRDWWDLAHDGDLAARLATLPTADWALEHQLDIVEVCVGCR
jgi:hypothetical protein